MVTVDWSPSPDIHFYEAEAVFPTVYSREHKTREMLVKCQPAALLSYQGKSSRIYRFKSGFPNSLLSENLGF